MVNMVDSATRDGAAVVVGAAMTVWNLIVDGSIGQVLGVLIGLMTLLVLSQRALINRRRLREPRPLPPDHEH